MASVAQYFRGLGAPRIFLNWLTTSVSFAGFDIEWPPEVIAFFNFLKSINIIDIDVMSPECAVSMTYQEAWLYYMFLPIIIGAVLITFYVITSQSSNPFGTAKQRAAAKDPDRRKMWLTFAENNASAWSFINELRSLKAYVFLFDELDNSEWYLNPTDAAQYKSYKKNSIRLWKKREDENKVAQKWIKIF